MEQYVLVYTDKADQLPLAVTELSEKVCIDKRIHGKTPDRDLSKLIITDDY